MIFEGMADFLYDIDELIRYKENISKTNNVAQGENEIEVQDELIDYSESNNISKIISLQKLGLIEHMRSLSPFNTTTNSLANALSGVTGIKPSTIQPMLNAMLSKGTSEKNNPLKSIKTVNVVVNKLANIGYKTDTTKKRAIRVAPSPPLGFTKSIALVTRLNNKQLNFSKTHIP